MADAIEPSGVQLRRSSRRSSDQSAATRLFGSGWAWLVKNADGSLDIVSRPSNAGTPMTEGPEAAPDLRRLGARLLRRLPQRPSEVRRRCLLEPRQLGSRRELHGLARLPRTRKSPAARRGSLRSSWLRTHPRASSRARASARRLINHSFSDTVPGTGTNIARRAQGHPSCASSAVISRQTLRQAAAEEVGRSLGRAWLR